MAKLQNVLLGSVVLACAPLASAQNAADIGAGPRSLVVVPPIALREADAGSLPDRSPEAARGPVVGIIVQTSPSAASGRPSYDTDDPFIQRRVERAQARADYRARVEAARQQYRKEKRAADAALLERQGWISGG